MKDVGRRQQLPERVALIVEHNTPEPAPLTETSVRVETYSYAGNGGAQTIQMGVDRLPTALLIVPVNPGGGMEQHWWWESRQGVATMSSAVASFGRVWPHKGKFHVVHSDPSSPKAIAFFDPLAVICCPLRRIRDGHLFRQRGEIVREAEHEVTETTS